MKRLPAFGKTNFTFLSPFSKLADSLRPMPSTKPFRLVRKRRVIPYARCGAVYAWLRTHVAEVRLLRDVEKRSWALLIDDMIKDDVAEADGSPPKLANVSGCWQRVLRDVAAREAAAIPRRPVPGPNTVNGNRALLSNVQPPAHVPVQSPRVPAPGTGLINHQSTRPPPGTPEASSRSAQIIERLRQKARADAYKNHSS